jgi:hypothetical protein
MFWQDGEPTMQMQQQIPPLRCGMTTKKTVIDTTVKAA